MPTSLRRYHDLLVDYGAWEDREHDGIADRIRDEAHRRFIEIEALWRAAPAWDRIRYRWRFSRRA